MAETQGQRRDRHANEALALEEELATIATSRLDMDVRNAGVSIIADFLRGKNKKSLAKIIRNRFKAIRPRVRKELVGRLDRATALGVQQGNELAMEAVKPVRFADPTLEAMLKTIDPAVTEHIEAATELAASLPLDDRASIMAVLAKSHQAVTAADASARWAANRAISLGTAQAAMAVEANIVWLAERNGCLHCLAYQGQVIEPGSQFPKGLTFSDRPIEPYEDFWYPPLHPNCRCQVDLTYHPVGTDDTLVREAQRSVARGSALASEPASRRAADRLLQGPTLLPKTVVQRARRRFDLDSAPVSRPARPARPTKVAKSSTLQDFSLAEPKTYTTLQGGLSSRTELATLPDGRQAIRKTPRPGVEPEDNIFLLDGEELLGSVAEVLGAPIAKTYRSDADTVWVELIQGETEGTRGLLDSSAGILIGLADVLSGYGDRESGLRNDNGILRAFDNGGAWLGAEINGVVPDPFLREPNSPMRNWIGPDGNFTVPESVTKGQLQQYRSALVALGPAFKLRGRESWLVYTLNVLDILISIARP
jgi:hypothetical protein